MRRLYEKLMVLKGAGQEQIRGKVKILLVKMCWSLAKWGQVNF